MKISPFCWDCPSRWQRFIGRGARCCIHLFQPTVLQITREYIKPYKAGAATTKRESAFVAAMNEGQVAGALRCAELDVREIASAFSRWYRSFAEWEEDNKIVDKNPFAQ